MIDRKPLASAKRRPKSIAWLDIEWERFTRAALARGRSDIGPFVRECASIGLNVIEAQDIAGSLPMLRRHTG